MSLFIVGLAVGNALGCGDGCGVVGSIVGTLLGLSEGLAEGKAEGCALVGEAVGAMVGMLLGAAVAIVGAAVGLYVTSCTPAPATTAIPEHVDEPVQPSWIKYVCIAVPAGTVYCTCAQRSVSEMHCAGGPAPLPVSSYTTSTPPGVYTRSVV